MTGDVACLFADLLHTSSDNVLNGTRINTSAIDQSGQDMREEVHWMGLRECTPRPTLAEWRAYDIDDVRGAT
jgi:hypothetical protein